MKKNAKASKQKLTLYIDGAGARPDGTGSGFAWLQVETDRRAVKKVDGLTNNQAEYEALLAALQNVPEGASVEVLSDSSLLCGQFNGRFAVRDPKLFDLLSKAQQAVQSRKLEVKVSWIPRSQNRADKLL